MDMDLLLVLAVLSVLAWPASCAADPVLFPVTKDAATSLYTIPIRDGANHVIDLAGPLLWSTCAADHLPANFPCNATACKLAATAYRPPGCRVASQPPCKKQLQRCAAYPSNPVTGKCAAARLAHTRLVTNTTDGINPLRQVSIRAVAACAPGKKLLARLPSDVTGVAGLAASGLALPAQVAASQRLAARFLLCLPRSAGGEGVAIFGGGPLFLLPESAAGDLTSTLAFTSLRSRRSNPSYYLPVKAIAVDKAPVKLPANALAAGRVVLGTTAPYTALRPDVYRPFVDAFDGALRRAWNNTKRVAAVAPFELCYDSKTLPGPTRIGWLVPEICWNKPRRSAAVACLCRAGVACALSRCRDRRVRADDHGVQGLRVAELVSVDVRGARVRAQVASWTASRSERRAGEFQWCLAGTARVRARVRVRGRVNRVRRAVVRIAGVRMAGVVAGGSG